MIQSVEPSGGSTAGGHPVYVRLRNPNPLPKSVTPSDMKLLAEIKCMFQDATVPGTYQPATEEYPWLSVRCSSPPRGPGAVGLGVSLNGQEYTIRPGTYTYMTASSLTPEQVLAEQGADDSDAFVSWVDYQTSANGSATAFYNAFFGVAESESLRC